MYYLALDIGNVLFKVNIEKFTNSLSKYLGVPISNVENKLRYMQKSHDLGLISISEILENEFNIHNIYGLKRFLDEWNNVIVKDDYTINIIDEMSKQINIALLSNIGKEHAEIINNLNIPIINCSIKYFSYEVGARKPQSLYYQSFLDRYPEFNGCTYVDDIAENLEMGKKFGFKTIEYNNNICSESETTQIFKEIEAMIYRN